jgi:uncharacterized protein with FMN-binding domain
MPSPDELAAVQARLDRLNARRSPDPTVAPTRRRHPAAGSRLAALGLSVASTAGLAGYFLGTGAIGAGAGLQVSAASVVATPAATSSPQTKTPTATSSTSSSVDGATYSNRWGQVQVRATFAADGSLTAVDAVEVPGGRGRSVRINESAVPRLEAEALAAQGATIDTVSGATYTSTDYRRSLQSAIDAARAAGLTTLA